MADRGKLLVLGIGNRLLSDDGIGIHVVENLAARGDDRGGRVIFCDGGTLGLALLPDIEAASALIVVDAAMFDGAAGETRVFEGAAMDAQVSYVKTSAHEVALADIVHAARFSGCLPERRALVGVAPQTTQWGLEPSPSIAASLPAACAAVEALIDRWA